MITTEPDEGCTKVEYDAEDTACYDISKMTTIKMMLKRSAMAIVRLMVMVSSQS